MPYIVTVLWQWNRDQLGAARIAVEIANEQRTRMTGKRSHTFMSSGLSGSHASSEEAEQSMSDPMNFAKAVSNKPCETPAA
jgi:hypothetical protein